MTKCVRAFLLLAWLAILLKPCLNAQFIVSNTAALRAVAPIAIRDLVPSPVDYDILYAAGDNAVWRIDRLRTWERLTWPSAAMLSSIAIDPRNPETIFAGLTAQHSNERAGDHAGLIQSNDGGRSWRAVPGLEGTSITHVLVDQQHVLWVAVGGGAAPDAAGGLLASIDGGLHWWTVLHGTISDTAQSAPGIVNAAIGEHLWSCNLSNGCNRTNEVPFASDVQTLAADDQHAILYAGTRAGEVLRSRDGGSSWTDIYSDSSRAAVTAISRASGGTVLIALAPATAGEHARVLTASPDTLPWRDISGDLPAKEIYRLFSPNNGAIYAATDAGLFVTTGARRHWRTVSASGTATSLIAFGGGNQSAAPGTTLQQPIIARAVDASGNGVSGVVVAFSDSGAGGSFNPVSIATDSNGFAQTSYTLPTTTGTVTVTASAPGLQPVTYSEYSGSGPDFAISMSPSSTSAVPNSTVQFTVSTTAIGGDTATISLTCSSPPTGCSSSPATVAPGSSSTLVVATGALSSGSNNVVVNGTDGTHTHSTSATVTVLTPDFTVSATPSSQTVTAGSSGNYTVSLTGSNGFSGAVALACKGLPMGATCAFNPAQPSISSSATVTSALTISTTSRARMLPLVLTSPGTLPPATVEAALALLLCSMLLAAAHRFRAADTAQLRRGACATRWRRAIVVGAGALALVSCGGGNGSSSGPPPPPPPNPNGTPAGTYTVTITAVSGAITHQTTVSLVVN